MQVIFSPVDISLFSQSGLSRGRTASAKKKDADGLQRDISIFVYDTFRRYIKHHYGVGIACALVGGDFPALSALCGFLEKESKIPMVIKSLTATRHFLEMSMARIQSERSTERTHSVKASVHTHRIAHLIIPLVTLGVGCFLVVFSMAVLGWYLFAPADVVQKVEDVLSAGTAIERTFIIDFSGRDAFQEARYSLEGKQIVLTQQKTVTVMPSGTKIVGSSLEGAITEENLAQARYELRSDLKKMLVEQVDWQKFMSVDTGNLSLTDETVNSVDTHEGGKASKITLTATGRLLVSLVEKQDIERILMESVSSLGTQPNIVSWNIKNFYYLSDTTKGMVTISALIRNSR